jgi:hypothetical protein
MDDALAQCDGAHSGQGCGDILDGRCARPATRILTLVGGPFNVEPTDVEKCEPCAAHWRSAHPERIAGERTA